MSLKDYLKQIQNGEPINFNQFLKCIPKEYQLRQQELFSTRKVANDKWIVSPLDKQILNTLLEQAEKPANRIHAAKLGDSHQCRVTVSFLLVYHDALTDIRPEVIYLSTNQIVQTFNSKSQLLIIENEENFFHHEQICSLASNFTDKIISIHNTDIVLGSGNKATSQLHLEWYARYEHVLCLFDYDLGGLRMFKTLAKKLNNRILFIQPNDYKLWLSFFRKKPETTEKWLDAQHLAKELGFYSLAEAFFQTRQFMEQEVLLKE